MMNYYGAAQCSTDVADDAAAMGRYHSYLPWWLHCFPPLMYLAYQLSLPSFHLLGCSVVAGAVDAAWINDPIFAVIFPVDAGLLP